MLQLCRNAAKTSRNECLFRSGPQWNMPPAGEYCYCSHVLSLPFLSENSHQNTNALSGSIGSFLCDLVERHGLKFSSSNPVSLILLSPFIFKMICFKGSYMTCCFNACCTLWYKIQFILDIIKFIFLPEPVKCKAFNDLQTTACRICNKCDSLMCYLKYLMVKQMIFCQTLNNCSMSVSYVYSQISPAGVCDV